MPAEVLGRRVDRVAGAVLERPLQHGRGEGVVHGHRDLARGRATTAAMSTSASVGLAGVSTSTRRGVADARRRRRPPPSPRSPRCPAAPRPAGGRCRRTAGRTATTWPPTAPAASSMAVIAAMPEANATACSACSSSATPRSQRAVVGLCSRAYTGVAAVAAPCGEGQQGCGAGRQVADRVGRGAVQRRRVHTDRRRSWRPAWTAARRQAHEPRLPLLCGDSVRCLQLSHSCTPECTEESSEHEPIEITLDRTDVDLLHLLQDDARMTNKETGTTGRPVSLSDARAGAPTRRRPASCEACTPNSTRPRSASGWRHC